MSRSLLSLSALACLLIPSAFSSNVVVLPQENGGGNTGYIYSAEPFAQIGTFPTDSLSFEAVWHPNGQKFYVISKSITKSITVFSGTAPYAEISSRALPNIVTAKISPDGRRLYVLSQALRIYDTATDQEITGINTGGTPIDIDFAIDSSRVYVLNSNGSIASIDGNNNQITSNLTIQNSPNSLVVGPNGLIYVTAANRLIELDGRGTLRQIGDEFSIVGSNCLRPQFTPDGSRIVVSCNASGTSNIAVVEVATRAISTASIPGGLAERLKVISNSSALFYVGVSNTVYRGGLVSPIANPIQAELSGVGPINGGRYLLTSDEVPTNRYFFSNSTNSISRINLETNTLSNIITQPTFVGPMFFIGRAPTGIPFSLITINPAQTVAASALGRPLVVRVLDSTSRPLSGVTVTFSTTTVGAQLSATAAISNKDGFASVDYTAPATTGAFTITASTSGTQAQTFAINVTGLGGGNPGGGGGTTGPITIVSGNGQLVYGQFFAPELLTVRVRDGAGAPQVGATVTWQVQSGDGIVTLSSTQTDAQGIAQTQFGSALFYNDGFNGPRASTIRASAVGGFVDFIVTAYPSSGPPPLLIPANPPNLTLISPAEGSTIRIPAGGTASGAIRATIFSGTLAGFGSPIQNIGFSGQTGNNSDSGPTAQCAQTNLSNAQGEVTCDIVAGSRLGTAVFTACVGNCQIPGRSFSFNIEVTAGVPGLIVKRQGDNQSGGPGTITPLALRGTVTDSFGNRLAGVVVQVEVIQGDATLESLFNTSNADGDFSFLVRFGSTPGEVRIRTSAGAATTIWTVTNNVTVGNFVKVSGDNQNAIIGRPFTTPLTVQLFDSQQRPINGATVAFSVSNGVATLSAASATTNTQGQATVNVTAGATAGPISITATSVGRAVSFNLQALPPGPTITRVSNAASFQEGLVPCGLATIFGLNIAPSLSGVVLGNSFVGPYALALNNVSVQVGGRTAPIVSIANIAGQEQATIQTPCDVPPGPTTVRMTVNEGSSSFPVTVFLVQPGIFETTDSAGRKIGVVIKADGTYVSLENPAVRGERLIGFFGGLGQLTTPTTTNTPGAYNNSSNVAAQIIIGLNNEGVPVISATMAPGLVGIYIVQFEVPEGLTSGTYRPYGIGAIGADGAYVPGNASALHLR